jgi:hypothetical protein
MMEAASQQVPTDEGYTIGAGEYELATFTTNQIATLTTLAMTNMTAEELNAKKKKKQKAPQAKPGILISQAVEANVPIGLGLGLGVLVKR